MKKFLLFSLFAIGITTLCIAQGNSVNSTTRSKSHYTPLTTQPVKTIIEFLEWYGGSDLQNDLLVKAGDADPAADATTIEADSMHPYRVDFKAVDRYLSKLKKSGFVSTKYLDAQLGYFKLQDSLFIASRQFEGPPEGFDADLIMLSQDYNLAPLKKSKAILEMISPTKASVVILFSYNDLKLTYGLTKVSGKWKIDSIVDSRD